MSYNIIRDFTNIEVGYVNGPVTVAEAKAFCRAENSTAAQDNLFALWIRAARTKIEAYTGLSLIPRNIVAVLSNPQGNMELPFGPVTGTPVFRDENNVVQEITTQGLDFPFVPLPFDYSKVSYTAGYADGECKEELKIAILMQVCYYWENRGDQMGNAYAPGVISICQKWKR
jgi:hypothetical protein